MARYIDAERLIQGLRDAVERNKINEIAKDLVNDVINLLQKEPTADVVEVVRCEKCKYGDVSCHARTIDGKKTIACYCNLKNKVTDVDYYCSSGERRDT